MLDNHAAPTPRDTDEQCEGFCWQRKTGTVLFILAMVLIITAFALGI